ncbi:serine/threonine protein kinase [Salix suchowensis]|nr:serine/threonine protein kinase [Salix suchowensis]
MGAIPSIQNIPSLKIVSPKHGDTVQANTDLQLSFVVQNMQVGAPTDDGVNFLSAPQQLNKRGVIIGYPIIIIEKLPSLTAAQPGNAKIFAFSKTVIDPPVNGISQDLIRMGLPPGVYRISVQLRAVNRQPILVSTPEHGALGDMITAEGANNDSDAFGSSVSPTVGNSIISAAVNTQDSSQSSLILDPKVISSAFASAGKGPPQVGTNHWFPDVFKQFHQLLPVIGGYAAHKRKIVLAGSCNPVPMGVLPDVDHMPSSKFTYPKNGDNIPAGKTFTISLAVNNLQTGSLANPQKSFLAAPQQVNAQGLIIGHAKVVIEALTGFNQTSPTDPTKFAFFEHIGSQAQGGILTASVNKGLPDGYYRLSSMLSATNSQPIVVPLLQPGIEDDTVYVSNCPISLALSDLITS